MTAVVGVNHVTLCCTPRQLAGVEAFYAGVLGLQAGPRPSFDFPGAWLYAGSEPVVHLAAIRAEHDAVAGPASAAMHSALPGVGISTGAIDHVALRMRSTVDECRQALTAHDIRFSEAPVPDFPLYQLFVTDPLGVKLELNFELAP